MIIISLSQGQHTILDDDAPRAVLEAKWYAKRSNERANFYAVTKSFGQRAIFLHRLLLGVEHPLVVDHNNGDSLDNRMSNIRQCTTAQNLMNQRAPINSPCGYRGVKIYQRGAVTRYIAQIGVKRTKKWIGIFPTVEAAAKAYDESALVEYGQFARLNFPRKAA